MKKMILLRITVWTVLISMICSQGVFAESVEVGLRQSPTNVQSPLVTQDDKAKPNTVKEGDGIPDADKDEEEKPQTAKENDEKPETATDDKETPDTAKEDNGKPETATDDKETPDTGNENDEKPETAKNDKETPDTAKVDNEKTETANGDNEKLNPEKDDKEKSETVKEGEEAQDPENDGKELLATEERGDTELLSPETAELYYDKLQTIWDKKDLEFALIASAGSETPVLAVRDPSEGTVDMYLPDAYGDLMLQRNESTDIQDPENLMPGKNGRFASVYEIVGYLKRILERRKAGSA